LIVKKMVEMGKSKCILYFDELDKACSKHGNVNEISSILIHLTDPNMNKNFQDRFFQGIDFPLDKVIMIFSYNDSNLIDPILLDRLTEIKVKPYNIKDKIKICTNHIIPEINSNIGIPDTLIKWSPKMLEYLVNNYTNEAGVRGIKRVIEKIVMNLNILRLKKEGLFKKNIKKININQKIITKIMKDPVDNETKIHNRNEIGIINGLYATASGRGGIIPIQIFKNFNGSVDNHEIKLTGKQGDVMKESVQCSLTTALNFIEKEKDKYNISDLNDYIEKNFKYGFHVHTPSTSTPKDGPSAGCAFTSAFISLILKKPIKNTIGMTGEIELTGNITKIGGLEFKLNGAKKAGVKTVYVPKQNKKDVIKIKKDYPKLCDKNFNVIIVDNISDFIDDILI
jgi:ATP-dependent Lon protease